MSSVKDTTKKKREIEYGKYKTRPDITNLFHALREEYLTVQKMVDATQVEINSMYNLYVTGGYENGKQ